VFGLTNSIFGLQQGEAYHSDFFCHISLEKYEYLIVYVDDIIVTVNDATKISQQF